MFSSAHVVTSIVVSVALCAYYVLHQLCSQCSIVVVELFGFYSVFKTFLSFMCGVHDGVPTSQERTKYFLKKLKFSCFLLR